MTVQNIRIFFSKHDRAKYISHLDMTRLFQRAVRRSGITMWYTEGFHPHLYMTFALPLSLGIESDYECVDMKLVDNITLEGVKERLNFALPESIRVIDVKEPVQKSNQIASSRYEVKLFGIAEKLEDLKAFLSRDEILAEKKGKAGIKTVNIKKWVYDYVVKADEKDISLTLCLASGNTETLNPQLLINTFFSEYSIEPMGTSIVRKEILLNNGEIFN